MNEWLTIFYNNIGIYNSIISKNLSLTYKLEPLGQHIKIVGGYAFKSSSYKNSGIPVIRISDFHDERIDLSSAKYYDESSDLHNYELVEGDIIIAMTGGTIGKLAIVQSGLGKLYLNQRVGKFKIINPDEFESEYVYWIARGVESKIKELAWGAAIPNVSGKQIESLNFIIPPKNIQVRIISFFNDLRDNTLKSDEYFDLKTEKEIIELQEETENKVLLSNEHTHQLDLLKKLRLQILQDAVQGKLVPQDSNDEPASKLLERIKAEKEQLIKRKKLKRGKPTGQAVSLITDYEIPMKWDWCKVDDVLFVTKLAGFEYTNHISLKPIGEIPVIRAQNVRPYRIEKTNLLFIDEKTSLFLDRCALTKKCLLFTFIGAGIGDVATFDEKERWHLAPNVAKAEPFDGCEDLLNLKYINFFMMSKIGQKEIFKHMKATAQPSLSMSTIRDIDIAIPPLQEQHRIVTKINQLMTLCDELEQSIQQNQKYTQELLQVALKEALEPESP